MKALEILITIRNSCKVITPIGDFYNYEKSDALIQEAIAELEVLKYNYEAQEIIIKELERKYLMEM